VETIVEKRGESIVVCAGERGLGVTSLSG